MSKVLWLVAAAVAGAIAAVVTTSFPNAPQHTGTRADAEVRSDAAHDRVAQSVFAPVQRGGPGRTHLVPIAQNEDIASATVEEPARAHVAVQPDSSQGALPDPARQDLHAQRQRELAEHEQALAVHEREGRDNQWAFQMESQLQAQFAELPSEIQLRLQRMDCRTRTCSVVLTWPSHEAAREEITLPSQLVASIPCATRMTLPEPIPGQSAYEATLLMDCGSGAF